LQKTFHSFSLISAHQWGLSGRKSEAKANLRRIQRSIQPLVQPTQVISLILFTPAVEENFVFWSLFDQKTRNAERDENLSSLINPFERL
jgi:hypothetical protein